MPTIRSDIVDIYLFRRSGIQPGTELLQLRRATNPMHGSWHPVMGHIERGETAAACAVREMREETGLTRPQTLGLWALEQVHPFYIAKTDEIVMSPRFAAEVAPGWEPTLNDEHDAARWIPLGEAPQQFLWPGQVASIAELRTMLDRPDRLDALRLDR